MKGKNYGICHGCRQAGHWLGECPIKMICHVCGQGLIISFEEDEVSSSRAKVKNLDKEETDQLSQPLKIYASISDEDKVEVTVVTFRPSERSLTDKGKEKVQE